MRCVSVSPEKRNNGYVFIRFLDYTQDELCLYLGLQKALVFTAFPGQFQGVNQMAETQKRHHVDPPSSQEQFPNFKFSVKEITNDDLCFFLHLVPCVTFR